MSELINHRHISIEQLAEELNAKYKSRLIRPIYGKQFIRMITFLGNVAIQSTETGNFTMNFSIPKYWILISLIIDISIFLFFIDIVFKNILIFIIVFIIVFFLIIYSYYIFFYLKHKKIREYISQVLK